MPNVSIIVPTYNCAAYLGPAVESALKQSYPDFEILIVDDGSTDSTKDILRPYLTQHPDKIRYIYQDNQGLANARNTGLKHARGQWIALLDADDIWFPNRLAAQLERVNGDPQIGLVHANITLISEEGKVLRTPRRRKKYLSGSIFNHIFLRDADVSCPTILFRKDCCDEAGTFDPYLARLGCEDRDLWLRISQKYRFVYIDQVLAYYRIRQNSMSANNEKMLKAQLYVVDKYTLPEKKFLLRRMAIGRIYRNEGDEFLRAENFAAAQKSYLKSIRYWPFSIWPFLNGLKAVLRIKTGSGYNLK